MNTISSSPVKNANPVKKQSDPRDVPLTAVSFEASVALAVSNLRRKLGSNSLDNERDFRRPQAAKGL